MVLLNEICRWWIDTAAATSLLLLGVIVAVRLTRQPAQRVRMIQAALVACMVIALCNALPGLPRISLTVVEPHPQATLADGFFEDAVAGATKADLRKAGSTARGQTTVARIAGNLSTGERPMIGRLALQWRAWVACGALLAGAAAGMRLIMAWMTLRRWRRKSVSADLWTLDKARAAGAGSNVAIRISSEVDRPCAWGVLRPVVFLPKSVCGTSAVLGPLLRHELAHLKNRDSWSALLLAITQIALCGSPLLWWVGRELRLSQEILADAEATADTDRGAYAEALLSLVTAGRAPMLATAAWASRSDLLKRMQVLLSEGAAVVPRCGRVFTLTAAVVAIFTSSMLAAVSLWGTSDEAALRASERRGVLYLMQCQEPNGGWLTQIGPAPTALAVRAILNAGIDRDNPVVKRALAYVESTRRPDGGFYTDHEPSYHTAIVLSMYAGIDTPEAQERVEAGRKFLQVANSSLAQPGAWYTQGKSGGGRVMQFADPSERTADAVLETYGAVTYSKWKSLVYAGLTPNDGRVRQGTRWIEQHWTLDKHPGTGNIDGLYYYYLASARTLRASGSQTLTTADGRVDWRKAMQRNLQSRQAGDGSWVNGESCRWLEDRPELVTAYALLALQATK